MTEKSADDDDFDEFMEGILPAGPSDETGEGHLDFDEEDEPEVGDEGIVVEELITDNEEDGSGDSGRKRGGTGKRLGIGVAVLAVVGTASTFDSDAASNQVTHRVKMPPRRLEPRCRGASELKRELGIFRRILERNLSTIVFETTDSVSSRR